MIVVMKSEASSQAISHVISRIEADGYKAHLSQGEQHTIASKPMATKRICHKVSSIQLSAWWGKARRRCVKKITVRWTASKKSSALPRLTSLRAATSIRLTPKCR